MDCNHTKFNSWWEYDRQGIELCRVCDHCIAERLKKYDPAVLTQSQREVLGISGDVPEYEDVVDDTIEAEDGMEPYNEDLAIVEPDHDF